MPQTASDSFGTEFTIDIFMFSQQNLFVCIIIYETKKIKL